MANENRTTLKTYFETGDIPTEAQFATLIDSCVNRTDDHYTPTIETVLTQSEFGGLSIDCSLGTSFYFQLIDMNVTIGPPANIIPGQIYTIRLQQVDIGGLEILFHSSFKQIMGSPFVMPPNGFEVSIVQFYMSQPDPEQPGVIYLLRQTDYAG